jgi:hypothetical protein
MLKPDDIKCKNKTLCQLEMIDILSTYIPWACWRRKDKSRRETTTESLIWRKDFKQEIRAREGEGYDRFWYFQVRYRRRDRTNVGFP